MFKSAEASNNGVSSSEGAWNDENVFLEETSEGSEEDNADREDYIVHSSGVPAEGGDDHLVKQFSENEAEEGAEDRGDHPGDFADYPAEEEAE